MGLDLNFSIVSCTRTICTIMNIFGKFFWLLSPLECCKTETTKGLSRSKWKLVGDCSFWPSFSTCQYSWKSTKSANPTAVNNRKKTPSRTTLLLPKFVKNHKVDPPNCCQMTMPIVYAMSPSLPATARLELERMKCWKSSLSATRPACTYKNIESQKWILEESRS